MEYWQWDRKILFSCYMFLEFVHESVLSFVLYWKGGALGIGPGSENSVDPCVFFKASC